MQFTVPQFIDHEPKIIGFMTLKQFLFIGAAAGIIFISYFTFGKTHFMIFLMLAIIIGLCAFGLAFLKVNEKPLPQAIANIISFSTRPRLYLWHRKENPIKMIRMIKEKPREKKPEDENRLKLISKSSLKDLAKKLEIR
jgi:hypothetical protein